LASEIAPERDLDGRFFTHRMPRRLPAEVLLDAINQAAGTSESFEGQPPGTRAIQLPDPSIRSYFLTTFGRPLRNSPCECARSNSPDLAQTLHLLNGTLLQDKLTSSQGRIAGLLKSSARDETILEELYLATLSRPPTDAERDAIRQLLADSPNRQVGYEDVLWTLFNCPEFLFNH
jgi:hypothetical protein